MPENASRGREFPPPAPSASGRAAGSRPLAAAQRWKLKPQRWFSSAISLPNSSLEGTERSQDTAKTTATTPGSPNPPSPAGSHTPPRTAVTPNRAHGTTWQHQAAPQAACHQTGTETQRVFHVCWLCAHTRGFASSLAQHQHGRAGAAAEGAEERREVAVQDGRGGFAHSPRPTTTPAR